MKKIVLITGATTGIGKETAIYLAKSGYTVYGAGRRENKLKELEAFGIKTLTIRPGLKNLLFDFSEPHKIDPEAFMNRNFTYNVPLSNFAKLSGRSLAGFKRDFEKIFNTSPGNWLQQRRLKKEAYFLIREKGKKPSDIYLDVGFENLSHFPYAFKNAYGLAPSIV
ncbi:MAG: SDR family NAD(P)-dependent oxidoreductase [Ginsengibacter sp.]